MPGQPAPTSTVTTRLVVEEPGAVLQRSDVETRHPDDLAAGIDAFIG